MKICRAVKDNCYNLGDSYGMVCVRCGCCAEDEKTRVLARLALHRRWLSYFKQFDGWFEEEDLRALQEKNISEDIQYQKKQIAFYEKELRRIEKGEKNDS